MKTPFLGGTYEARSRNLAYSRCVNLFPETVETKEGKEVAAFYGTPGLTTPLVSVGNGPIRGGKILGNNLYVVSGPAIYQINLSFGSTLLGTPLSTNAGPVSVIANTTQVLFSDAVIGVMWTPDTSTLSTVASFPSGGQILAYDRKYGVTNIPGTQRFFQSNLGDLGIWGAANYSSADSGATNLIAVAFLVNELWLFCIDRIEVWIDAGLPTPGVTYQKLTGVLLHGGCIAPYSIAKIGDSLLWLGQGEQGVGVVYQSQGYRWVRRSTHAIETAWQSYKNLVGAIAYSYQQDGHDFYVITFPADDATWVLDATTGLWHERSYMDSNGLLHRHRSNFHAYFSGRHVVGDYENGNLYKLDMDTYTDNGSAKKWIRSWRSFPSGQQPYEDVTFDALQIDMQKGILVPDGTNPHMNLRWSNDGGHNWSNEMIASVGKTGDTAGTVRFRRLGSTSQSKGRDRIFELSSSDVYPVALIAADMDASKA